MGMTKEGIYCDNCGHKIDVSPVVEHKKVPQTFCNETCFKAKRSRIFGSHEKTNVVEMRRRSFYSPYVDPDDAS